MVEQLGSRWLAEENITAVIDERMTEAEVEELAIAESATRTFCLMDLSDAGDITTRLAGALRIPNL